MAHKIVLYGVIGGWDLEPPDVRRMIDEAHGDDLYVEINSPGGYVYDGLEIYHLFKNYAGNVHFHVMSLAASMASIIPLAGDRITAEEATVWMIHNPWGSLFGADYIEARKFANYMESLAKLSAKIYAKRTGKTEKVIKTIMDADSYFFGEEALEFGLVDEIIKSDSDDLDTKDDAVAYAQLEIEECVNKMKNQKKKEDVEKIAACLNIVTKNIEPQNNTELIKPKLENNKPPENGELKPSEKDETKPEVIMTLKDFIAQNPSAQIEINALVEAGRTEILEKVKMASKYFTSEYPGKIKQIAAEAIVGTKSIETLEALVAMHDMNIEEKRQADANAEQPEETPAQQIESNMVNTGIAGTAEDITALAAQDREGY